MTAAVAGRLALPTTDDSGEPARRELHLRTARKCRRSWCQYLRLSAEQLMTPSWCSASRRSPPGPQVAVVVIEACPAVIFSMLAGG